MKDLKIWKINKISIKLNKIIIFIEWFKLRKIDIFLQDWYFYFIFKYLLSTYLNHSNQKYKLNIYNKLH